MVVVPINKAEERRQSLLRFQNMFAARRAQVQTTIKLLPNDMQTAESQ
jgi:hypothetical protein